MSDDPVIRLAMQRVISASADIEAQLNSGQGTRPIGMMLLKSRNEAAVALAELALHERATIENLGSIQKLQDRIKRYDDHMHWLREIVSQGFDYDQELTHEDREEMIDILSRTPEGQEEAAELGLIDRSAHATD